MVNGRRSVSSTRAAVSFAAAAVSSDIGQNRREFVASEARYRLGRRQGFTQSIGDLAEKQIADAMAEIVVDFLEIVQIDEENGEAFDCGFSGMQGAFEALFKQSSVRQTREAVMIGLKVQVVVQTAVFDGESGEALSACRGLNVWLSGFHTRRVKNQQRSRTRILRPDRKGANRRGGSARHPRNENPPCRIYRDLCVHERFLPHFERHGILRFERVSPVARETRRRADSIAGAGSASICRTKQDWCLRRCSSI